MLSVDSHMPRSTRWKASHPIVHLPDWHPDEPVSRPLDISGLL